MSYRAGDVWSLRSSALSRKEHWDLFDQDGTLRIQRFDENPGPFTTDDQTLRFVSRKAAAGSRRHVLALCLDNRKVDSVVFVETPFRALVSRLAVEVDEAAQSR